VKSIAACSLTSTLALVLSLGATCALSGRGYAETATSPPPAAAPAEKPFLGVQVDTAGGSFDSGILVSGVVAGSTAAVMGVMPNDRISAINGHALLSMDDLAKTLQGLQIGSPITLDVLRKGEKSTLSGTMTAKPPPPESARQQLGDLQREVERLKKRAARAPDMAETLDDVLTQLNQLKKDLPKAAEDFKKQYPNGIFEVKIEININSDTTAKDPLKLGDKQDLSSAPDAGKSAAPASPNGGGAAPPAQPPASSPHTP